MKCFILALLPITYTAVLSSFLFPFSTCLLSGIILTYSQIAKRLRSLFLLHAAQEQLPTQKCSTVCHEDLLEQLRR